MKNRSDTNASFKNRSSESVHLKKKKRLSAILIHCSWSFFETYSFTWLIFDTHPFTWSSHIHPQANPSFFQVVNRLTSRRYESCPWSTLTLASLSKQSPRPGPHNTALNPAENDIARTNELTPWICYSFFFCPASASHQGRKSRCVVIWNGSKGRRDGARPVRRGSAKARPASTAGPQIYILRPVIHHPHFA